MDYIGSVLMQTVVIVGKTLKQKMYIWIFEVIERNVWFHYTMVENSVGKITDLGFRNPRFSSGSSASFISWIPGNSLIK